MDRFQPKRKTYSYNGYSNSDYGHYNNNNYGVNYNECQYKNNNYNSYTYGNNNNNINNNNNNNINNNINNNNNNNNNENNYFQSESQSINKDQNSYFNSSYLRNPVDNYSGNSNSNSYNNNTFNYNNNNNSSGDYNNNNNDNSRNNSFRNSDREKYSIEKICNENDYDNNHVNSNNNYNNSNNNYNNNSHNNNYNYSYNIYKSNNEGNGYCDEGYNNIYNNKDCKQNLESDRYFNSNNINNNTNNSNNNNNYNNGSNNNSDNNSDNDSNNDSNNDSSNDSNNNTNYNGNDYHYNDAKKASIYNRNNHNGYNSGYNGNSNNNYNSNYSNNNYNSNYNNSYNNHNDNNNYNSNNNNHNNSNSNGNYSYHNSYNSYNYNGGNSNKNINKNSHYSNCNDSSSNKENGNKNYQNNEYCNINTEKSKKAMWDDENDYYKVQVGEFLNNRYKVLCTVGSGTFSTVVECWDVNSNTQVAIKIVRSAKKYTEDALVEIDILKNLEKTGNSNGKYLSHCIKLLDSFLFKDHICLVFKRYGLSLYEFLKKNRYRPLPLSQIQKISKQLLTAIYSMHKLSLVHTDLKPENILLESSKFTYIEKSIPLQFKMDPTNSSMDHYCHLLDTDIVVIDFGGATFENTHHTSIVCSRPYRPPEIILGMGWSYPCDIWGIGCILVELYLGYTLFDTHNNVQHLAMMEKVMGPFPNSMSNISKKYFNDYGILNRPQNTDEIKSMERVEGLKQLKEYFHPCHHSFFDLATRLLEYQPSKRISASDALCHPFLFEIIENDCF